MKILLLIPLVLFVLSCGDRIVEEVEDTTPPTVSISSPVSGQIVAGLVIIEVSTQDNEGISRVEFFIDDSLVFTDTESPYNYEWETDIYFNVDYIIKVISFDKSGNFTPSQPILISVSNNPTFVRGKVINVSGDPVPDATIQLISDIEFGSLNRTILDTNYFESANILTYYNIGDTALSLYFGIPIPEDDILSCGMPPLPPSGAFDIRFSDDTRCTEDAGVIRIMGGTELFNFSYEIKNPTGEYMIWVLTSESGTEDTLQGTGEITNLTGESLTLAKVSIIPETYSISNNYPNPFYGATTISYDLPEQVYIKMWVTDSCQEDTITTLVDGVFEPGSYSTVWDGKDTQSNDLPDGVYCIKMEANEYNQVIYSFLSELGISIILSTANSDNNGVFLFDQSCLPFGVDATHMGESPNEYLGSLTILRNVLVQATHSLYGTITKENVFVDPNLGLDVTIQFE